MTRPSLTPFAWLSIAAATATIGLKAGAYLLTGSVGLLSDALESVVNLAAACVALVVLAVAARPPDEEHAYGHDKAEYFAGGIEGALILVAAASIAYAAVPRLFAPQPLEQLGLGLALSVAASLVNLGVALVLLRAGRRYESITLEADARHLLTDVWTSAGVLAGVGAVALTGWERFDPVLALLVAGHILWTGAGLVRRAVLGLMDTALPAEERAAVQALLDRYQGQGIRFHALRTRQAGALRFVSVHVLVPGNWTVQRGHDLLERLEEEVRRALPNVSVLTHLEPIEDPASWEDLGIVRGPGEAAHGSAPSDQSGAPAPG
ncbi:MAG: cation transporter [Gemmataceae bacterium]|nr:cation transporter [Gemmataceae bacterium]